MKWLRNEKDLPEDDRFQTESVDKTYKLVITDAHMDDADKYTIKLPTGKTSAAKLTVEGKYWIYCEIPGSQSPS